MKTFIIHVPQVQMSKEMGQYCLLSALNNGWEAELYDGFYGKETSLEEHGLFVHPEFRDRMTDKGYTYLNDPGSIGLILTNYNLWKKCVEMNEPIYIAEHDTYFVNSPPEDLEYKDIARFDALQGPEKKKKKFEKVGPYRECIWGAGLYAIKPHAAQMLIDAAENEGLLVIDPFLSSFVDNKIVRGYMTPVNYVTDRWGKFPSIVDSNREKQFNENHLQ